MSFKQTVLIVEDEMDLLEALESDVQEMGYTVLKAQNGLEAYKIVESTPVHIILSDLNMPRMGGPEFLTQLRKKGFHHPFIALTGYGTRDEAVQLLRLGAYDILNKPISYDDLKNVLDGAAEHVSFLHEARENVKQRLGIEDLEIGSHMEEVVYALARLRALRKPKPNS